jgi:hypothetical protein
MIRKMTGKWLGWSLVLAALGMSGCDGGGGLAGNAQAPDPVVQDFPIAYVKRVIPVDQNGNRIPDDAREPFEFHPGAQLILRDRAAPTATETVLTDGVFAPGELYDVKDLSVSYDGRKLLFAMRAPEIPGADPDAQPTWNIWEYDLDSKNLRRVIASDTTAEAGQDFAPHYLPDGSIVFASTRQQANKAILLDEGKPQFSALDEDRNTYAAVLHVMSADGTNIRQITFNQSHDLDPEVLSDGRILFTRWENAAGNNVMSLYTVRPDGSDLQLLYGHHSHDVGTGGATVQFVKPREMPDGRIMVITRPFVSTSLGAELSRINTTDFVDNDQPTYVNTGMSGPALESLTGNSVTTDGSISPGGYYAAAFPLFDGTDRLLVSWSQCRLQQTDANGNTNILACTPTNLADPNLTEAPPLYGIWMLDQQNNTVLPIVTGEEGFVYTDVVAMQPRNLPNFIPDPVPGVDVDDNLVAENAGVLNIHSVYDFDGVDITGGALSALADPGQTTVNDRPFVFLRLVKAVSIPDDMVVDLNGTAFGRSQQQLMRDILGYAPIEPDGSVRVKVPANVPFMISLLDRNGRRVSGRHNAWLQVKPGEELVCSGCHTAQSTAPHGRRDAEAPNVWSGATTTGQPFPNTDPALFADMGETMAETYTRINGLRSLSMDVQYVDDWTDPAVRPKDASFAYLYGDLSTPAPTTQNCLTAWNATCRSTINYPDIIQPIWDLPRQVLDVDGVTVLADNTCTTCHSPMDANGAVQVPASQLDLSGTPSSDQPDHLTSYRELLFTDQEQEIVNGALIDRLVQATDANGNPLFEVDANGNLILDANGNPIPVMVTVPVAPSMSVAGASASTRFFSKFDTGGSHQGWLTPAELRLIAEWLDIGGQYYNNPFAVPQN